MSIKVAYDISTLGTGFYHPRARAGVFRVVENLARGLNESPECELSFCAAESFNIKGYALDYLATQPEFATVPFIGSGVGPLPRREARAALPKALARGASLIEAGLFVLGQKGVLQGGFHSPLNRLDAKALRQQDIYHSPFHPLPEQLKTLPKLRRVLSVYDLIPILFPQFFQFREDSTIRRTLGSLREDDWVLCCSESTKHDLCDFLPHFEPQRVTVTPLGAAEMFYPCHDVAEQAAVRAKYSLPEAPYLLSLCTLEPRKNIDHAIRCFARVVQEHKIEDLNLVLVGTKGWDYERIFASIDASGALKERVLATGFVADEDLAALYSGALAFVYPSLYEGFGLPPLEAMQCGVPVICSNTSSLPEVVGEAGILVEPTDEDALCAAMLRVYEDEARRAEMSRQSLQRAALFSWRRCIEQTVEAYHKALAA